MSLKVESIKSFLGGIKTNLRGTTVDKKVIIIESDDWGAIRTPSKEVLQAYSKKGFDLSKSLYKVDALASGIDLDDLFDLLLSHKNRKGISPVFTANAIMANPDFDKIKASSYRNYYYEPFYETFRQYPEHQNNLLKWKKGIELGIFIPEYHGREHLNISRWLGALQKGDKGTHFSFDWKSTYSGNEDYSYMEAFDWDKPEEVETHKTIIQDGAKIFQSVFERRPRSFIAPCYNWDPKLEKTISEIGITWIQGNPQQQAPTGQFDRYNPIRHHFGKTNGYTSKYSIRNVYFEPASNPNINWTDKAMARISAAFLLNKPAVISTHRINYVGFIDPQNKSNGLFHLNKLLKAILKKWPDVDFISTSDLSHYVK